MINLKRFFSNWQNVLALLLIGFFVFVAIAAPYLAPPDDPDNPALFRRMPGVRVSALRNPRPPNPAAPLGTVSGGWDILYSLIWGTRSSLRFGLVTALSTACFGILVGAISGYLGGSFNRMVLRVTDAFLTFPAIAGIFLFRLILAPGDAQTAPNALQSLAATLQLDPVMLALILFSWMPYARMINSNIIKLKQTEYAMAAMTVGLKPLRIILRHLLPNAVAPAIVLAARDIGGMVILEAAFTFIGIGAGLPWGILIVAGRDWVIGPGGNPLAYSWVYLPTTLTLVLFSIGWNLLGDGLNNALTPWAREMNHRFD
ncbi:MAG: ABC transporter permease [Anaerolineae bacterium]|nr:ABC transporter permease [Anaerolineae bacterium]